MRNRAVRKIHSSSLWPQSGLIWALLVCSLGISASSSPQASAESLISQLGADIDGEAADDQSGFSVSLSSDGTRVAIGARANDGNGSASGHTRIYQWNGATWTQLGADIDGEAGDDWSGHSVSLSSDGTRVAIGAPFNNNGNGLSGHTRIYEWNGTAWTQLGADIDGEAASDRSGYSVSLSSDGTTVAIGAPTNDGNGLSAGHTRIYEWNGTAWTQLGADIDGESAGDQSGASVSLSSDGTRVAIGARANNTNTGHTRVYEFNAGTSSWEQLGADIDGEAGSDLSGHSVSLSSNGARLAIGAIYNDGNGLDSGHMRVYEFNAGTSSWEQLGADIDGEQASDESGYSVSLSGSGSTVAIGARFNDGNGISSGHTRIFAINAVSQSTESESAEDPGDPGIFLALTGEAGAPSQGFGVTFGAYAVAPNSPYVLVIRNDQSGTQRVLTSGTMSLGGHLEESIQLPRREVGSHLITLSARSAAGAFLTLGNRIVVDEQGNIQSVSPEELQPRIR